MLNKVILIGRLTKDIDLRTSGQTTYLNNTLAVQRTFKNKDGDYDTDFVNIVFFGKQAEYVSSYSDKGMLISVVGKLQIDTYLDQKTQTNRTKTSVVCEEVSLLERRKNSEETSKKISQSLDDFEQDNDKKIDEPFNPFNNLFRWFLLKIVKWFFPIKKLIKK